MRKIDIYLCLVSKFKKNADCIISHTIMLYIYQSVDADNSGQISASELRAALVNSNWSHFNEETCRLLIGMFDKDQ